MRIILKDFTMTTLNQMIDLFIVLYIKGRAFVIMLYYHYLKIFAPKHRILFATTKIADKDIAVLDELITYFEYDIILSCASLQRWFREKHKLSIDNISFIYLKNNKPVLRRYNLDDEDGLKKEISFEGELEYVQYGDLTLEI